MNPKHRDTIVKGIMEKAKNQVGKTYSLWQIFGMLFWSVCGLAGWKLSRNPIRGGAFCTERAVHLKMDAERYSGIVDPLNFLLLEDDTTFPAWLLRVFLNSSKLYETTWFRYPE